MPFEGGRAEHTMNNVIQAYAEIASDFVAENAPFAMRDATANGRKARVYLHAAGNLPVVFADIETQFPSRNLTWEDGNATTYAEIFAHAKQLGAGLQDKFAIRPGDPVGLVMSNRTEWFIAFIAITWIGGIAVLFNSRGTKDELAAAISTIGCAVIIADEKRAALLDASDEKMRIILAAASPGRITPHINMADLMGVRMADSVDSEPDMPAAILFTSGTTGRPKGAVLTHRNLTNMVRNLQFLSAAGLNFMAQQTGIDSDTLRQMVPPTNTLLVSPLFHISGITAFFSTALAGGTLTLVERWRPQAALPLIASNRITMLSGPPLIVSDLLDQEGAVEQMATLNNIAVGGQATPSSLMVRVARALPMAGQSVGWGMTEVCGSVSAASGAIFAAQPNSSGLLSPLIDLRVVDDEGRDLPIGECGELWLRGGLVMQGYWNDADATEAAFDGDWYKTGDIGFFDPAGFVFIVDRKKDMVICGGENIYCAEVERVLSKDEAFSEISVFGVPDERAGERVVAAVTLREGYARAEDDVKEHLRSDLAAYKIPSAVIFDLGPFPRNAAGKINKAMLRAIYLERLVESV